MIFLNNLSVGCYVDLVTRRERYEKLMNRRLAKITSVIAQLFFTRRLRITLDGKHERVCLVWVGNGAFSGAPHELPERESLESGFIDVRILRAGSRFPKLKALVAVLSGKAEESPAVDRWLATSCVIEFATANVHATLDGELVQLPSLLRIGTAQSLRVVNSS
jgi:diacylglycerol kinase family enzyme